jgi:transcriptional regulator with XRE-family HTH domain
MRRLGLGIGEDVRRLRIEAGVSLATLAGTVDVHRSHIQRIEAAKVQPSLEVLTAIGVALGADLGVRYFEGTGPRLHDRFQSAMVESFLRSLDDRWRAQLEVAVSRPARGVIDIVLEGRREDVTIAAEVHSELRRLEQQIRWANEKADGLADRLRGTNHVSGVPAISRLLVVRSTVATREIARRYEATLATAYPARTHDLFMALTEPLAPWPGPGIVWMHLRGGVATLMPFPPPRIQLGR